MHSVCRCSLPVWRRSFFKKGTPVTYFCPALDPPLGGSGRKTTTLVRDHEYFMHTKFHQNPSSGSGEEVENVKSLRHTDDGRRTDGRTDDGRCAMTIAHSSLRLRWAKNKHSFCKFSASWPLSIKKKTITMTIYVKSIAAFTLLRHWWKQQTMTPLRSGLTSWVNVAFARCVKVCCVRYTMTSLFIVFISAEAM